MRSYRRRYHNKPAKLAAAEMLPECLDCGVRLEDTTRDYDFPELCFWCACRHLVAVMETKIAQFRKQHPKE